MEEEIKMEEKNTFDELVNKVTDVKIDETKELLTNADVREKFTNDLAKYCKDIQFEYYLYRDRLEKNRKLDLVIANINVTNFKSFNIIVNDFRLSARQAIISKKLRSVYLLREEELLKTISDLRAKIDDFDIYSASHSNEEIMEKYSNQELTEFSTIRNQSIPMYLIELETLSAGIDANTKSFNEEINMAYTYAMKLLDILIHEELINCVLMNKEEKSNEAEIDENTKTFNKEIDKIYDNATGLSNIPIGGIPVEKDRSSSVNKDHGREENGTCKIGPKE